MSQKIKNTTIIPVASLQLAQQQLKKNELHAFATNKGILFEMADELSDLHVLADRWGFENLAIACLKGREAANSFLEEFSLEIKQTGQLKAMIDSSG
ncbi:MAG: hypothetical protein EXR35_04515 [Limnohabitans sp.]|nr:hypothetical protein [Limnohabitans sp.]